MNPRIGVFGKLPSAGDFVAVNCAGAAARALDHWLRDSVENIVGRKKPLPQHPMRFLFRDERGTAACIGVAAPSRDKVGRAFPICIFSYLDMPVATHRFPSLPTAFASFLDGAARVLASAHQLDPHSLASYADVLPIPGPEELEEARVWAHQSLGATHGINLLEALFGPVAGGVQYHALSMFRTACGRFRGADPGAAPIVLECPASDDVQLVFWLRAAYQLLSWRRAPPSFVWSVADSRDSRLLLALGAPDAAVLHFLADPNLTAERLWPMRTDRPQAVQAGRRALPPSVLAALEPPAATAEQIFQALVS